MKAKKSLGQHFLKNENIAKTIVDALDYRNKEGKVDCLEIGPGTGVLTKYLLNIEELNLKVVELDNEAIDVLNSQFQNLLIINKDILRVDFKEHFNKPMIVIGNIPYNITGPIFFKILENKEIIEQVVFMIQKEVADRILSKEGSKVYGILSVLLQCFFDIEHIVDVKPQDFLPPPKVESSVIKLNKKAQQPDIDNFNLFKNIVKAAFNQRRKTLKNALSLYDINKIPSEYHTKRAEQLSINDFLRLYKSLQT